jgi:hypothetical protein
MNLCVDLLDARLQTHEPGDANRWGLHGMRESMDLLLRLGRGVRASLDHAALLQLLRGAA